MLEKVRLGRTDLMVTRVAMGCIPIQRLSTADAVALLHKAFDAGINFYDTANAYTDSEAKVGAAFSGMRDKVIIATKTMSKTYKDAMGHIDNSLRVMKTDYVDIWQWHNPAQLGDMDAPDSVYAAMLDAQKAGKVRHVSITNHNPGIARQAIASGRFATLQFPLSMLSSADELALAQEAADADMGVIAMKGMCGGMLPDGRLPYLFLAQYPHIVPIWGLEKESELQQFIDLANGNEKWDPSMYAEIDKLKAELGDAFCRGCGYCLPCPAGIQIPLMMRITYMINRTAHGSQFTPEGRARADKISDCIECRKCESRCPYHLPIPEQLRSQQAGFRRLDAEYTAKTAKA